MTNPTSFTTGSPQCDGQEECEEQHPAAADTGVLDDGSETPFGSNFVVSWQNLRSLEMFCKENWIPKKP